MFRLHAFLFLHTQPKVMHNSLLYWRALLQYNLHYKISPISKVASPILQLA